MKYKWILFLALLSTIPSLKGQVLAPDFLCITEDTLRWQANLNTCGPFQHYEVYASQQREGPYQLLAQVSDPAQDFFFHDDVNDQLWYYYLQAIHDCPGQMILASDTLDNLLPLIDEIHYVSVTDSGVRLVWPPSNSPEVIAYLISRNTSNGTTVLDTVFNDTTYLDISTLATANTEMYFVTAIDACGNKSLISEPHETMVLNSVPPVDCSPDIQLSWNSYAAWANRDFVYEIFVEQNGQLAQKVGEVSATTTSFIYRDGRDMESLCFYVEAFDAEVGYRSRSTVTCQVLDIIQPLRRIELLGVSVRTDQQLDLEWFWDDRVTITSANTMEETGTTTTIPVLDPTIALNSFTLETTIFEQNLSVEGSDDCGNTVLSNFSAAPNLSGEAGSSSNRLSWIPYQHPLGELVEYELRRISANGIEDVVFTDATATTFDDILPAGEDIDQGFCYYLLVEVVFTLSDGSSLKRNLRSNQVCLQPAPNVYIPNVFAPNSANNTFRPFFDFEVAGVYTMTIYDRWGGVVFQTDDPLQAWDGRRNNRLMPEGVYVYIMQLQPNGGEPIEREGDVLLLY